MKSRSHYFRKSLALRLPCMAADAVANKRHLRSAQRILVIRHVAKRAYVFRDFLAWITARLPELRRTMEFRRLPVRDGDLSRYNLLVSWAGDTMDLWSPRGFAQAVQLQQKCTRLGIPTINRLDCLAHTAKRRGAELMQSAGVRTPRAVAVENLETLRGDRGGISFPLLIREDRGHGQPAFFIESPEQLELIDLSRFHSPIAVEYIDTRSREDGLFRKYRYVVAGDGGVPRHMIVNDQWEVRPAQRLTDTRLRQEELEYVNRPDPNHDVLDRARRALGLDVVGFDYSCDRAGRVVVWEANPFLNLNYPKRQELAHLGEAVQRSFAVVARLYCQRAKIAIPTIIDELLSQSATVRESDAVRPNAA